MLTIILLCTNLTHLQDSIVNGSIREVGAREEGGAAG